MMTNAPSHDNTAPERAMRTRLTCITCAVLLCLGGLTSCSDEPDSTETASTGPPVGGSVPSPVTTAATTTSAPATVPPTSSVPTAGVVTDEIEILPSVDYLDIDEHGVWAKLEPALVYLIDPTTNEITEKIRVEQDRCDGIGVGDGSVWTCSGRDVVRIDPTTGEVVATFPVDKTHTQGELPVAAGKVWILTGDGSSVVPIDTATNTIDTPIPLPARGTDLGAGPSGIWVVSSIDHVVMHIDAETRAVLSSTEVARATDVAVEDDQVWVVAVAETVMIDPVSGAIGRTVPVGGGIWGSVALTKNTVWVRGTTTFVTRIDRATGELVDDENSVVYDEIASRLTSGGDIAVGFGSVWTSAFDDGKLFRISTGEP